MVFDLLIRNGKVVDGSGGPSFPGDIGVTGDRITAIGALANAEARETIDAAGMAVCPGFVDVHTHSDFTLLVDPRAESQIHQGVTTEVVGQCGYSLAPISSAEDLGQMMLGYHPSVAVTWKSFDEYLTRLQQARPAVNVAALVGHGPLRLATMKGAPRPASMEEIAGMKRLLAEAMEQGGFGFSTGLEYQPGKEARTDELVELCKVAAGYNGLYATHVRNRDLFYDLAFAEAISVARNSGVRLEISHINPKYGRPDSAMAHTLEMVSWARTDGVDVRIDLMPSNWNHTAVAAFLPSWAFEGGIEGIVELLTSAEGREKLKHDPQPIWQAVPRGEWRRIRLFVSEANPGYIGMTLEEIARERGQDPYDVIFDLLLEEGPAAARMICVGDNFSEDDIRLALTDSYCSVISDSASIAPDGPYAGIKISPLGYNWAPRFFQKYIREEKILSLEEGVRRVTRLPASAIGLTDRGVLRKGAMADITVFDAQTIADNSTIEDPNVYPDGIAYVVVNGQIALNQGDRQAVRSGMVLRRS